MPAVFQGSQYKSNKRRVVLQVCKDVQVFSSVVILQEPTRKMLLFV